MGKDVYTGTTGHFDSDRREFLGQGIKLALLAGITGTGLLSGCDEKDKDEDEEKKVSPPEDLMQEHGVLNRILLIYDTCKTKLENKSNFPLEALNSSALLIRKFVEDYHEKQEENYLFTRFEKAGQLTDLVSVLRKQHSAGRTLTDQIVQLSTAKTLNESEAQALIQALTRFNIMYRPHEAREDTVLFPAFRKLVSDHEYDSLGEDFEKNEQKLFGKDGFERIVNEVAEIEKKLNIYELSQFTP